MVEMKYDVKCKPRRGDIMVAMKYDVKCEPLRGDLFVEITDLF
jgi:hypothetical protein